MPKARILVVDDEAEIRRSVRMILEYEGYDVQEASSGAEAVALLEREPPDLAFLDIKMGAMTGFDLLKWIRAQKALDALPVIMYSSSDYPADVEMARELGAQGYIKKYPSTAAMQTVLEEAIEFAMSPMPKKTFLQWSYRFVESADAVYAK